MQKIFKKILIPLFILAIFFGGFSFDKNSSSISLVKSAYAQNTATKDAAGNLTTTVTDTQGIKTTTITNAEGKVTSKTISNPATGLTTSDVGGVITKTSVSTANGIQTTTVTDGANKLISTTKESTDPNSGFVTKTITDGAGKQIYKSIANPNTLEGTTDNNGTITKVKVDPSTGIKTTTVTDAAGNLVSTAIYNPTTGRTTMSAGGDITQGQDKAILESDGILGPKVLSKAASDKAALDAAAETKKGNMFGDFLSWLADAAGGIANFLPFATASTILYVLGVAMSFLVVLASALFNGMMILTIEKLPEIIATSGIDLVWAVFRDIINIFFIFILLYTSIATIIGTAGGKTKSMIANVIIAAILINFSLFFTKVLIDASNIATVALYSKAGSEIGTFGTTMMDSLDLVGLFSPNNITATGQASFLLRLVLNFILLCGLFWSYLLVGFLLLGRMISFLLLMATSPVAFLKGAIPWLDSKSDEWWSAFTGQLLLAPAFMFVLIIISKLMEKKGAILALSNNMFDASSTYTGSFTIGPIIYYVIIIAVLITGVKQVKKLSGEIGNMINKAIMAAAAIIAIAVTGGGAIALRGGAALASKFRGGNGGPGAGGPPGSGPSGGASRISGTLQKINSIGKFGQDFITGKLGERPGVGGLVADFARNKVISSIKGASDGAIDLSKVEKTYKKFGEDRIKNAADVNSFKVDAWKIDQALVDAEIERRKSAAQVNNTTLQKDILTKKQKLETEEKTLTAKERKKIESEIEANQDAIEMNQKLTNANLPAEEKMKIEEDIRKEMAKKESISRAKAREAKLAGQPNNHINKQAASIVRGYIKSQNREKTEGDKQIEILEEIKKNSKTP